MVQSFLKRLLAPRQEDLHGNRAGLVLCILGAERASGIVG